LTKLCNEELPSVKAADLVNYVVLASVYTTIRTNSIGTGKGNNTYIAPQAATAAAAALYVTDRADVQPIVCRLSPTNGLAAFQPNNHTRCSGLAFNGLHPLLFACDHK